MSALPRKVKFQLNVFELGYLHAALNKEVLARMESEAPMLWLQIQANVCRTYAESDGHPAQKSAKKDFDKYHKKIHELLEKENG